MTGAETRTHTWLVVMLATLLVSSSGVLFAQDEPEAEAAAPAETSAESEISAENSPEEESASPMDEVRPDTGRTLHLVLETSTEGRVSREELLEPDPETLAQVERLRERLLRANPRGEVRPLPQIPVVPTEPGPESTLGATTEGISVDAFTVFQETVPSDVAPGGFSSSTNEPAVAIAGHQVFYTGNWYAATSDDRGDSFAFLNPFSGPFSPVNDGFCCDQVTSYDPATNTLFFLQQYIEDGTTGTQRINVDQGADGVFDCFLDTTPQDYGFATNNWADFPDMTAGDGYLYHSSNVFSTSGSSFTGAFVARYDLSDLASCSSVSVDAYTDTSFFSFKLTRGATDTMYFADHITTASLRVWTWTDAAPSPTSTDVAGITSWSNAGRSCPDPDGNNWCGFIDSRLGAAWVADGVVGFMWTPAQDGTFPQPHLRAVRLDESSLTTILSEPVVWSSTIAWAYPAVDVNANGDLGGALLAGSSSLYPSCLNWIADDVNNDLIAPLENVLVETGTAGPTSDRAGDYSSAQTLSPYDLLFAGACYTFDTTTSGESRFTIFGREAPCSGEPLVLTEGFNDLASTYRSDSTISTMGAFEVSAAVDVHLLAKDGVSFEDGFAVQGMASFSVEIDNTLNCSP